jgi:creatinine deaminase
VTDHAAMLDVAIAEARAGLEEGGIPIGAALFDAAGAVLGRGHNRRVQDDDPSAHGETDAFRNAGRRRSYGDTTMATTLAPCWYCSGLIRQFGIGTVVVGESETFQGGIDWLRECGVHVVDLRSQECIDLLGSFIARRPDVWSEDIGRLGPGAAPRRRRAALPVRPALGPDPRYERRGRDVNECGAISTPDGLDYRASYYHAAYVRARQRGARLGRWRRICRGQGGGLLAAMRGTRSHAARSRSR